MTSETLRYAAVMLAAGIGIPVLAALNAGLGLKLASPVAAAVILFAVAMSTTLIVLAIAPSANWAGLATAPRHFFLGGALVAFYVLSITWVVPHFGVGNAVMFVLLGQLVSAALIDQFGLFGTAQTVISPLRAAGISLMAVGVVLTQRG
jgi:transporter family-2 protein